MTTHEPQQPEPGSVPGQPGTPPAGYGEPGTQPPAGYGEAETQPPAGYGDPAMAPPAFGQPLAGDPIYPPAAGEPAYPSAAGDPAYPPVAGQQAFTPGYTEPVPGMPGAGPAAIGQPAAPGSVAGRSGMPAFDVANVNPLDWGIIAAGLIALIFSTFGYYTYKISLGGFSQSTSVSAWHGALAPIATLLALAASLLLAVELLSTVKLAFPVRLVVLAAFALASLLLLLALFVVPGNTGNADVLGIGIDKGHGIGYWISLLAVLAGTGLAAKRFVDTGGKLPARG
ncbi:hypothetical protein [Jatrophihabitans sp.]|uniref:hypothetical protein n=1 Tax=Jatrophihabitans sp. TaxID=1932789 RepID=UPI002C0197EC|nr:hypothetical protein [Jatrophihabitans sp.]